MTSAKQNLLGLSLGELQEFVLTKGDSRYRGQQVFEWLYKRGVRSFVEMRNLGETFRQTLESTAEIKGLSLVTSQQSAGDGTTKFLFELADGPRIESVLIPPASSFVGSGALREDEQKRLTLCVSTQVGCPLDCVFCATATMGFTRNLTSGEIVDQVLMVQGLSGKRITNVVFMGMGEPMMNYRSVMAACDILVEGVGITARRITISTAGYADGIRRLADEQKKTRLAVSLHSANDATRTMLMPINRKFNLASLREAIAYYYSKTKSRVTFEYIFFDGINDSPKDVRELVRYVRSVPSKVNIIPFHSIAFTAPEGLAASLRPSPRLHEIVETLRGQRITVMVRSNAGEDIDAACGQLAVRTSSPGRRPRRAGASRSTSKA